jgi:hypothetical protein
VCSPRPSLAARCRAAARRCRSTARAGPPARSEQLAELVEASRFQLLVAQTNRQAARFLVGFARLLRRAQSAGGVCEAVMRLGLGCQIEAVRKADRFRERPHGALVDAHHRERVAQIDVERTEHPGIGLWCATQAFDAPFEGAHSAGKIARLKTCHAESIHQRHKHRVVSQLRFVFLRRLQQPECATGVAGRAGAVRQLDVERNNLVRCRLPSTRPGRVELLLQ